jgi:hypothetical protein
MPQMNGGCLCGQVRYSAKVDPIFSAVCHCKTCQKQTGTAFRVVVAVPLPEVSIQGAPNTTPGQAIVGSRSTGFVPIAGRRW